MAHLQHDASDAPDVALLLVTHTIERARAVDALADEKAISSVPQ